MSRFTDNALMYSIYFGSRALRLPFELLGDIIHARRTNGVDLKVENAGRVKIEGFEDKLRTPERQPGDLLWAARFFKADTKKIMDELGKAAEEQRGWRIHYLINRPHKIIRDLYRSYREYGFGDMSSSPMDKALARILKSDNALAAYYILKYEDQGSDDEGMRASCCREVRYAVSAQSDNIVKLMLNAAGCLDIKRDYKGNPRDRISGEAIDFYLQSCIVSATKNRRTDYLDLFREKKMPADYFVAAWKNSFRGASFEVMSREDRQFLQRWMEEKQVIGPFGIEALDDMQDAEDRRLEVIAAKEGQGWQRCKARGHQSVALTTDKAAPGKEVTCVFNFAAGKVEYFEGRPEFPGFGSEAKGPYPYKVLPLVEFDDAVMLEEGRQFLRLFTGYDPRPF